MKSAVITTTIEIISSFFILLFIYTAINKFLSHQIFRLSLEKFPLLNLAASFLSWAIPAMELVIALLLLLPRFRKRGLMAALGLMILFTGYMVYMLITSSHLPCSCGGVINNLSWHQHLWLNSLLIILAALAIFLTKRLNFLLQ